MLGGDYWAVAIQQLYLWLGDQSSKMRAYCVVEAHVAASRVGVVPAAGILMSNSLRVDTGGIWFQLFSIKA